LAAEPAACPRFQVFYVPQKPYLVSGSLRDQVMYPLPGDGAPNRDVEVLEALSRVNLLKLVDASPGGLDHTPHDWADVLSGGEKQRMGRGLGLGLRVWNSTLIWCILYLSFARLINGLTNDFIKLGIAQLLDSTP